MIKVILWDVDGTLLNFLAAEKEAIKTCFTSHGFGACTDDMIKRYSDINKKYWERLECGEITKREVLIERFREFFAEEDLPVEKAEAFNEEYQVRLGDTVVFNDDGYEVVKRLKAEGFAQYAVTNGTKTAQSRKLAISGLGELFDGVFISDEVGIEKPMKGFFDYVFEKIGKYEPKDILIIGDSLSSDMQGGNNAGILCCWYNPECKTGGASLRIDYEIADLRYVFEILEVEHECSDFGM